MPGNGFEIVPYAPDLEKVWNNFVAESKNGTFLLNRGYMNYHADRFADKSFLFFRKGNPYALLPACRIADKVFSHAGLTYGGLIMNRKITAADTLEIFSSLLGFLKKEGIEKFIYKPTPHIYHTLPSEEDLYALFRHNAGLTVRNISSVIDQNNRTDFTYNRRWSIKKAVASGIIVEESDDIDKFWTLLTYELKERYGAVPVHSAAEMRLLKNRFPENIRLFTASLDNRLLAGMVVYLTKTVAHCQYIASSNEGKRLGAVDLLADELINRVFNDIPYFDFGTSNEDSGRVLNESLIFYKESFGARAVCYDTYEIDLSSLQLYCTQ